MDDDAAVLEFPLRSGRRAVRLESEGIRHPRSSTLGGRVFTRYEDVTHLQLGARTLRFGTRRGVFWLPRRLFADPEAAENLVRGLLERIMGTPNGTLQLARMTEIEELVRAPIRPRASLGVALACIAVAAWGIWRGPVVHAAGLFSTTLVSHGEAWRVVTANFLHALFPLHLLLNVLGLLALGMLVERPLGTARTLFVLGLSALGASGAGWLAGYENLVGASGMVAGLAGAILWLEFRLPHRLPAFWRLPRRLFVGLLIADALLPLAVPIIAGWAHAGGFVGGVAATALCAGTRLRREPAGSPLIAANALLACIAAAALAGVFPLAFGDSHAWSRHAQRLLAIPEAHPVYLNDAAWLIATEMKNSPEDLERALRLAQRAVSETEAADPNILDTLAEVLFRTGRTEAALATIDRAIALAPGEPYFREQRRRFAGERAPDDLPPPPPALREPPVRLPDDGIRA